MLIKTTRVDYSRMDKTDCIRSNKLRTLLTRLDDMLSAPVTGKLTVYMAYIDNLQMLNTAYGHLQTDEIICGLCHQLENEIGQTHRVADSTVIILHLAEDNIGVKDHIRKIINGFGTGSGKEAHISSTIVYENIHDNYPLKAEAIFEQLYSSATYNKHWNALHDESGQQRSLAQMAIANQIYDAIDKKRLRLAFQPIVHAKTGIIEHQECLLRLIDENGNAESAGSFIDIAEKMGIIENIDLYVLDMVLDFLEENHELSLALNISNITVGNAAWNKRFFERITPDTAKRLTVEITETAAMLDLRGTAYFIATLQEVGCSVALDDFGSGHTSFNQLRTLSLDYVKIDGSLIRDIANNKHQQFLVKSLIEFIQTLGTKTIAEFVDGGDTAKFLIESGIDYMQGNYFGEPITQNI